jgi:hypothetical protein
MENLTTLNTVNNSWGWFVDIEAPSIKPIKPIRYKSYLYKTSLPTIRELPRSKSLPNIYNFDDEDDDDNPNSSKPTHCYLICYIVLVVILCIYLL